MNYSVYRFTLDIHKTKSEVSIPIIFGDTKIKFYISLNDGGTPYKITEGCTAQLACRQPSGKNFLHDCIIEDNRIVYIFDQPYDQRIPDEVGITMCDVRLKIPTSDSLEDPRKAPKLTTPKFSVIVEEKVVSDEEIKAYREEQNESFDL